MPPSQRVPRPPHFAACLFGIAAVLGLLAAAGCDRDEAPPAAAGAGPTGPTKVRVGYIGLTCEAPIFMAVEKGFFKEEGLDVEMVRCQWATYKDALALGRFDVTHHLVMYFLKPIEQGMDVKFTGGIHRGCLRVQAGAKGNIQYIEDLTSFDPLAAITQAMSGLRPGERITYTVAHSTPAEYAYKLGEKLITASPVDPLEFGASGQPAPLRGPPAGRAIAH